MTSKQLKVGDWVSFKDKAYKVYDLLEKGAWSISLMENGYLFYPEHAYVQPVRLTPEILEKNFYCTKTDATDWNGGYHCYEYDYDGWFYLQYDCDTYSVAITSLKFEGHDIVIHYVHELQHVLRLIGIKDLADNFKL